MDREVSAAEVQSLLEDENPPLVVDVSSPDEFAEGHIPQSLNVPLDDLVAHLGRIAGANYIVTVCPRGEASIQAARLLEAYEGTTAARIESMQGGLELWDGPLETGADEWDPERES